VSGYTSVWPARVWYALTREAIAELSVDQGAIHVVFGDNTCGVYAAMQRKVVPHKNATAIPVIF
jgi:hypothetical protein